MSTLHVRNVPDEVYESLRSIAEEHGSSIGAETVRLLRRALRAERPGVRQLLDEIEAHRPTARTGAPSAAELLRLERDAR